MRRNDTRAPGLRPAEYLVGAVVAHRPADPHGFPATPAALARGLHDDDVRLVTGFVLGVGGRRWGDLGAARWWCARCGPAVTADSGEVGSSSPAWPVGGGNAEYPPVPRLRRSPRLPMWLPRALVVVLLVGGCCAGALGAGEKGARTAEAGTGAPVGSGEYAGGREGAAFEPLWVDPRSRAARQAAEWRAAGRDGGRRADGPYREPSPGRVAERGEPPDRRPDGHAWPRHAQGGRPYWSRTTSRTGTADSTPAAAPGRAGLPGVGGRVRGGAR